MDRTSGISTMASETRISVKILNESLVVIGRPLEGTLLDPKISGSLKGDLIERVYIPNGSRNPNSYHIDPLQEPL